MMNTLLQDTRYTLRQLRRSPGFTLTAVLTLALGIGGTTAIFTLVYQILLRSIPVSHPEQLYKIGRFDNCCVMGDGQDDWSLFSDDLYRSLRDTTPHTSGVAAVQAASLTVSARHAGEPGAAQPLAVRFVSGNYFPVLGVEPAFGRLLTPADDRNGAPPVAVISNSVWHIHFHADPHLLGSTLLLTGHPVTVVGITRPNFLGERNEPDPAGVWLPLSQEPVLEPDRSLLNYPGLNWLDLLVRIPDRRQVPRIQLALQGELRQWIAAHRDLRGLATRDTSRDTTELAPASGGINKLRDQYESSLHLLLWVASFVLLIACANLANLMLVRGMARSQELAVRSALGASRLRLVRQMLLEALLLSLLGGTAALLVAFAGTRAILALALADVTVNPLHATPSLPVLGFALAVSLLTGMLFGTAPAWITSRISPIRALRGGNRSTRDRSALPQKLLVVLQAALSLALLSTAGLLITSLRQLTHQNFGFAAEGRLLTFIDLHAAGYTAPKLPGLYNRFDDAFTHLPGITHFAYATYAPATGGSWGTSLFFPGVPPTNKANATYDMVSPEFFSALGIHLLAGRSLSPEDTATSVRVAVVNQLFADTFFHGRSAIGEHFGPNPALPTDFVIVGVVENTRFGSLTDPQTPVFFTPLTQTTPYTDPRDITTEEYAHFATQLVVDFRGDPAAITDSIRRTVASIDPSIPVLNIVPLSEQLSANFTGRELVARLTTLFGILALLLAALGLYGVTAYTVARRSAEIGVRLALGSSRRRVLSFVLRGAIAQAGLGLLLGLPLSFLSARLLEHTLYGSSHVQPVVLLAVTALLALATVVAAWIPARRAAGLDPMHALRTE